MYSENSDNIASIYLDVNLDTSKVRREIQALEKERFTFDIGVNDKRLSDLNKHLDKKVNHFKEVQKFFRGNPLRPEVDDTKLTRLNQTIQHLKNERVDLKLSFDDGDVLNELKNIKKEIQGTRIQLSFDQGHLVKSIEESLKKVNYTINISNTTNQVDVKQYDLLGKKIGDTISKSIRGNLVTNLVGGLVSNTIGSVFTGAFENLGKNLSKNFNKGLTQSLLSSINQSIGSTNLVGDKLGNSIVQAITSKIPKQLQKELQEDINNFLGEENIIIERNAAARKTSKAQERKRNSAQEQTNIDRREFLRNAENLRSSRDNVDLQLLANSEATSKGLSIQSQLQFNNSLEPSEKLEKAIKEVSEQLEKLFEEERSLTEERERIVKELKEATEKVKKQKKDLEKIQPAILPPAYMQALKDVAGNKIIGTNKVPQLLANDVQLKKQGAIAQYNIESNTVEVTSELKAAIEAGKMTAEQMKVLYHELQHAVDFDFGSVKGVQARRNNVILTKAVTPSTEEYQQVAELLQSYAPEQRAFEMNAEVQAIRKSGKAFEKQERLSESERFKETFGVNANKFNNVTKQKFLEIREKFLEIASFGRSKDLSIKEESQVIIDKIQKIKNNIDDTAKKIIQIENLELPTESIKLIENEIDEQFKTIKDFQKELDNFKLEIFKKAKKIQIPINIQPIEFETIEITNNENLKQSINQPLVNKQSVNQGLTFLNDNDIQIPNLSAFEEGMQKINTRILPNFRKTFQDIKNDIKESKFDFVSQEDTGALAKAKVLLDNIKNAKEDIEQTRSELGIDKIGSTEASKINQTLSQLSKIENSLKRELNKAKLNIENDLNNDDDRGLSAQRLEKIKINRNSTKEDKERLREINKLLSDISDNMDDFDSKYNSVGKSLNNRFQNASEEVNEFFENVNNATETLSPFERKLANIFDKVKDFTKIGLAFAFLTQVVPKLKDFVSESINVARELENINRQVVFASGSTGQGIKNLTTLRGQAKDLNLNIRESLEGASGFLASTQNSTLEGDPSLDILKGFNTLLSVRGVDTPRQQRFNVALEQMASKGIQSEELRGQASEAVPGFYQIYARSQGLNPQQLAAKLKRTAGGLSPETLIQASQQAQAESISGLPDALNTAQASVQKLDNSILLLQENVGKTFLPWQKISFNTASSSIDLLSNNIENIIELTKLFAIYLTKPFWQPFITGALNAVQTLGLWKPSFNDIKQAVGSIVSALKPLVAELVIIQGFISIFDLLATNFKDLGKEASNFSKSSTEGLKNLKDTFNNKETQKSSPNFFEKFGSNFVRGLNPFDNSRFNDFKESQDILKGVKSGLKNVNELNSYTSNNNQVNTALKQINDYDKKLQDIQTKRRAIIQINPDDSKGLKQLQKEESDLIQQRYKSFKPVGQLQGDIEARIKDLKAIKPLLDDLISRGYLDSNTYKKLIDEIDSELIKLETNQDRITKAVGKTANAFDFLRQSILKSNAELEDTKLKIENLSTDTKKVLLSNSTSGNISQGQFQFLNSSNDIQSLQSQLNLRNRNLKGTEGLLNSDSAQRVLKNYKVNNSTGINEIHNIISQLSDPSSEDDKFILEQFTKYQENKNEIKQLQLQVAQAKNELINNLREQTKQVAEYYQGISRQVQEANLEFKRQLNQVKTNNITTKLREALGETEDSFLNTFVENLIGQIESVNAITNEKLNKQSKLLQNQFSSEDSFRQALELSRSLPGNLPTIKVGLDFKEINSDANVNQLNQEFGNTQNIVNEINQEINGLDNLLNQSTETTNKLTDEFNKQFNIHQEIEGKIQDSTNKTNIWQESLNNITSVTDKLKEGFTGTLGVVDSLVKQSSNWIANLTNVPKLLENIGKGVTSIGTSDPENNPNVFGMLGNLAQNALNSAKYGYASPSSSQSWDQVLKGSVSSGQSFFAPRPQRKGTHSGIDFDSTEGLGGNAKVNAMFPGSVETLTAWGKGASDPKTGASNAFKVKSALPGSNDHFYTEYGHMSMKSAQIKPGDVIQPGQFIGKTSNNDNFSQGGHLDIKIRIPRSAARNFKNTLPTGDNQSFVDVKEFMSWYQNQVQNLPKGVENPILKTHFSKSSSPVNTPSNVSGNLKRGGNELSQQEYARLTPLGKQLYEYRNNPNVLAISDVVARAEGTDFRRNSKNFGYGMMIGGENLPVNQLGTHPFVGTGRKPRHNSTASGRYQMMNFNYDKNAAQRQFGKGAESDLSRVFTGNQAPSFSPGVQDLYFIYSLKQRGVLDEVLQGNLSGALNKSGINSLAAHYASLENKNGRGYYPGQKTPEGMRKNSIPFAQQRLQARLQNNPAMDAANKNQYLSPNQLQNQVQQGNNLNQQNLQRQQILINAQSDSEIKKNQAEYKKRQQSQLNNFRKNLESNYDLRIETSRKSEDLVSNINSIKNTNEEFQISVRGITREYDDIEKGLVRNIEARTRGLQDAKKVLATDVIKGEDKKILEKKIVDDEKTLANLQKELGNVRSARTLAINQATENFTKQEEFRQQQIGFENLSNSINILKEQLQNLKNVQQSNPLSPEVDQIPELEKLIQLKESDLQLEQELAKIRERAFKKEISSEQAQQQINDQIKLNDERKKSIELNNQELKSKQDLEKRALLIEKRSKEAEINFNIAQEKMKSFELDKKSNPLVKQPLELNRDLQLAQNDLDFSRNLQSVQEFAFRFKLTTEETQGLIDKLKELNNIKLDNIRKEFETSVQEENIRILETSLTRDKTKSDFVNNKRFELEDMKIQRESTLGGNQFSINARQRKLGSEKENIRFEQEKRQFEIDVQKMSLEGIKFDESSLSKIREDMEAIHGLNLENINRQFKTFGSTLNDIARQSIAGLSQSLTGLIMGTESLNDVLDNFFNNILNQVINAGLQSLLGGLFGGSGGLFGLFYNGGLVPAYANGNLPNYAKGNLSNALNKERMMSGRRPHFAVVHENELIIPAKRTEDLAKAGLTPEFLLGKINNYATGNLPKDIKSYAIKENNKNSTISVKTEVINQREYVSIDQLEIAMQEAASRGADMGEKKVQMKLSNSVSFRKSVGL